MTNFVLYESVEFEFTQGLNCIVGDTGAGKSLIIKAMKFLLNQVDSPSLLRKKTDQMLVRAEFIVDSVPIIFEKSYIEGKNKNFHYINQTSYSQHEFKQQLLPLLEITEQNSKARNFTSQQLLELADSFIDPVILEEYKNHYDLYTEKKSLLAQLKAKFPSDNISKIQQDTIIKKIGPHLEALSKEKELEEQCAKLQSIHKKKEVLEKVMHLLSEDPVLQGIDRCTHLLLKFDFSNEINTISQSKKFWEDFKWEITQQWDELSSLGDIDAIMGSIHKLQNLKFEFGLDTKDIIELYEKNLQAQKEFCKFQEEKEFFQHELDKMETFLYQKACLLHEKRKEISPFLEKQIDEILHQLNIPMAKTQFSFSIPNKNFSPRGLDECQLLAQINPGSPIEDINHFASGGEKSRFLLAYKMIVGLNKKQKSQQVLFFDEIDAGISGESAIAMGNCLSDFAKSNQIIMISHLPQIAIKAHKLWYVRKKMNSDSTYSDAYCIEDNFSKAKMEEIFPYN